MSEAGVGRIGFESQCDFFPGCVTWTTCEPGEAFICVPVKWGVGWGVGNGLGSQDDCKDDIHHLP